MNEVWLVWNGDCPDPVGVAESEEAANVMAAVAKVHVERARAHGYRPPTTFTVEGPFKIGELHERWLKTWA